MATTHPLAAFCELANAFVDKQVASRSKGGTYVPPALAHPSKLEHLYGCSSCSFSEVGCKHCWDTPFASRPASRAKPFKGHAQAQLPAAPTFRPTAEEFRDPFAYLASIAPQAYKAGIAHIVPPEGWQPPIQMLDQETGMLRKDFQVPTRIQPTHLLCKRYPTPSGAPPASLAGNSSPGSPSTPQQQQQQDFKAAAAKKSNAVTGRCSKSSMDAQKAAVAAAAAAAAAAEEGKDVILNPAHWDAVATAAEATDGQFGYEHLEDPLSLAEFHRYADWAKRRHFNGPLMAGSGSSSSNGRRPDSIAGSSSSSKPAVASASNAWRAYPCTAADRADRGVAGRYLPGTCPAAAAAGDAANPAAAAAAAAPQDPAEAWQEPSIEEVEAEFWRIVEAADEQVEALYGQDIDTATYSSAFPTIKELAQAEARNLVKQRGSSSSTAPNTAATTAADDEAALDPANCCASCRCGSCQLCELRSYASHPWNINNLPQARGSVLRFVREDVGGKPITGLMVPWVYVGSCFSAFCWHIEDHGLYSINYNHMGAPKVWYGVPAEAAAALDAAMRDALPHLFERDRLLLHKLITMLSPSQLVARGVPVCRAVQTPGSFIVTFPDAYHAGFNSGFNVAEAVNFAAPDWLPFGSSSVVRYRCESRYMTFSHDAMLINVVREAVAAAAGPSSSSSSSRLALPAPDTQQQQQDEAADTAAAARRKSLLPQALQPQTLPGSVKGQFAAHLQQTLERLQEAEAAAAEQHWHARQQQQQLQCEAVRMVGPPGSAAAPAAAAAAAGQQQLAVAFSSSVLDSTFWFDAYPDGSWREAAEAADEAEARAVAHDRQRMLARQLLLLAGGATKQQQQQLLQAQGEAGKHLQLHQQDLLRLKQAAEGGEHHLAAASQQHHAQGQRERVFTMRGAAGPPATTAAADAEQQQEEEDSGEFLGPVAGAAAAIAAAGPSKALMRRAARGFATAAFVRKGAAKRAASAAAAAGSSAGASAAAAADAASADAAVQAIASYIMALAEARRQRMLFKPPSPTLAALAAGELALRLEVEGQRQAALALQAGISRTALMQGSAAAHDPASGVHINTQGVECATCGGDLSLAAVVSDADPGRAVCPEHIADLDGSRSQRLLLLRYAPGELQSLLSAAMRLVPGARQAVGKARQRQGWVAAGRFMGGAVLQKPAEAVEATAGSAGVAAVAVKQEPGTEQQQQQAAAAVKQEPAVEQQQPAVLQRPQQPVVEVKMLGRLYHPDDIDRKLFEDLDELGSSDFEDDEEEEELLQPAWQQQQRWEGVGDMEAEDDDAAAAAAADGAAAGKLAGKQQQQEEAADEDAEEGASGGEQSSGSWWQDELDGMEDAFGFYTFAAADAGSDDEGALEGSDDDFKPRRSGCRKRRRRAAGADGGSMRGKRVAMSDTVAAAVEAAA
uniref:JmjC domain-containing protein n=1 Tax=Tetradesmus obliquus TaxID=3088 RepID=A0A383V7Y9_TETOB|eukprot:jgi/Sobl393_1/3963/SZX60456.1